jgi:hypothetical protein
MDMLTALVAALVLIGGLGMYLMPCMVAFERGHYYRGFIAGMNIILGWTVLVWLGCMIWAVNGDVPERGASLPGDGDAA